MKLEVIGLLVLRREEKRNDGCQILDGDPFFTIE